VKGKSSSKYVAYYRVSTDKQGRSGLGLEAQRQAVVDFINGNGNQVIAEFTEVESGKRNDRPKLAEAMHRAKVTGATLVIAKLDRLARNVHFISGLMESRVDFVAVDFPQANRLTVHLLAAVAEHEREAISQRTKDALAAAKKRGVKLGNTRTAPPTSEAGALLRPCRPCVSGRTPSLRTWPRWSSICASRGTRACGPWPES